MDKEHRKTALRITGWILALVIVVRVGASLTRGLEELRAHPVGARPDWMLLTTSAATFLAAHAVLVLTWKSVLATWDEHLPFWTAARIWSVSNLGRYVPGKVWQIGVMGAMARDARVSPLAASASALLGTLVNILAGFVIALVSGRLLLERTAHGGGAVAAWLIALSVAGLLVSPWLVPRLAKTASRLLRREISATLPVRAVVYAMLGNLAAWLIYGLAFRLFVSGLLGAVSGSYSAYVAAYTISYLVGYIVLFAPAGIGAREGAMLELLQVAGLASYPQATLVTIASRVWLTLLEIAPALCFLLYHRLRRRSLSREDADAVI